MQAILLHLIIKIYVGKTASQLELSNHSQWMDNSKPLKCLTDSQLTNGHWIDEMNSTFCRLILAASPPYKFGIYAFLMPNFNDIA